VKVERISNVGSQYMSDEIGLKLAELVNEIVATDPKQIQGMFNDY